MKPWVDAGYPVMLFDKKVEGDILDFDILEDWLSGMYDFVYGVIAAPPCTEFVRVHQDTAKHDTSRIRQGIL